MIDIVIPAYNGGAHLEAAVRSVIAQESEQWRLHVVDDASPGRGVRDVVATIDDPRVSCSRNRERLGINAQFNKALTLGTAEHLVVMGEDDEMLPGYVAQVLECLRRFPDAGVVQPGVQVIDDAGRTTLPLGDRVKRWVSFRPGGPTAYTGEDLLVSLLRGNWTYFPSMCWRREVAAPIGFRPEYDVVLDLALLVEVLRRGHAFVVDPRPAFRYRRHVASLSSVQAVDGRRFDEEAAYFRGIAESLADDGMTRAARAARLHLTSRLHAVVRLPAAARARDRVAVRTLLRHVGR